MSILANFRGFPEPQYTKTPNLIFDLLLPEFSGSQLKVLLYVVRRTMGWEKNRGAFVSISLIQIQHGTGLSKETVIEAIKFLIENRMVLRRKQRDDAGRAAATEYRLRFDSDVDSDNDDAEDEAGFPGSENPTLAKVGKFVEKSDLGGGDYNKVLKEKKEKIPPVVPLSGNSPINPEDLTKTLCGKFKRLRGCRSFPKDCRDLVAAKVAGLAGERAEEEVLSAFEAWAGETYWLEYDGRHRVRSFFTYLGEQQKGRCAAQEPRHASAATPPIPPGPPNEPAGSNSGQPGIDIPYAAAEWNRVVTAGPPVEGWDRRYDGALPVGDPDFIAALPKVLALCQKAYEVQAADVGWLNFRWLLRAAKNSTAPNWYRMANGEMNWLRSKRGGQTRMDRVNDAIEQALANVS